ncbi:hypothetical protein [Halomarina pelagica]|uniref:hypothetical protein n=1 Tax=Halomarina pelagica TaxID=2961599 RepID=UPI0020C383DA|nr:hypothetical protein [Halomarina sp. BND7]
MKRTSAHLLFGRERVVTRNGILFAVALSLVVFSYYNDGPVVCWLLAGLPAFAAVARLQYGGWFGPPSLSILVAAGVFFGGIVALVSGTTGFLVGILLRVLRRETSGRWA